MHVTHVPIHREKWWSSQKNCQFGSKSRSLSRYSWDLSRYLSLLCETSLHVGSPNLAVFGAGSGAETSRPASTAAAVPDVVPDVVPPAPVAGELRRHRREERGTLEAEHGRWFRCESSPLKMECEPSRWADHLIGERHEFGRKEGTPSWRLD